MISIRAIPMVRLVIPFACGIFSAAYAPDFNWAWIVYVLPFAFYLLYRFSTKKAPIGQPNLPFGIVLYVFLAFFGFWLYQNSAETNQVDFFGNNDTAIEQIVGVVSDSPKEGKWWKFPVSVQAFCDSASNWQNASGTVMVLLDSAYLPESELKYGSKIVIQATPQRVEKPKNPKQFDYQHYLHNQNIHHQVFLKNAAPIVLEQEQGAWLWQRIYPIRKRLLCTLKKHLQSENTYAVGAAILLGYKDDLSDEVRQTFVETGTMHILAVSGAHVGILYQCLAFFLALLPFYGRRWQVLEPLVLMCCIWFFVLLTGAAEPAVRAAIMFSFYLIARMLRKDHNVYNILGLSAFIMLLYDPRQLFTIGFQLSFGAVLGIALFWQHFRKLIPWGWGKYQRYACDMIALGCAAQLGILPFSLYYFHQLPTFFWLTGTLVIPFATFYLWGSILLLTVGTLHPSIAFGLGFALDKLLLCMNSMLSFFAQLPFHLIEGVWLAPWMLVFLFISLYCLSFALFSKKKQALMLAVGFLFLVSVGKTAHWWQHKSQEKITAYSVGKNILIDGFSGTDCWVLNDSLDEKKMLFAAKNNRAAHAISRVLNSEQTSLKNGFYQPPIFAIGLKKIALLKNDYMLMADTKSDPIRVDAVYLTDDATMDLSLQAKIFETNTFLANSSVPYRLRQKMAQQATELNLTFIDLSKQGTWTTD